HGFLYDDALGERDARERAELRVAALDQLGEARRREPRFDRAVGRGRELRPVGRQCAALGFVMGADIDDERRRRSVVDEVVADPRRTVGLTLGIVAAKSALEHRARQRLAGGEVVRMPVLPVRHGDGPRTMVPNETGRCADVLFGADAAVGPAKALAPRGAEHRARRVGFGRALLDRAVAAEFAPRQVAQADDVSGSDMLRNRAAQTNLEIVRMRSKDQEIDAVARHGSTLLHLSGSSDPYYNSRHP